MKCNTAILFVALTLAIPGAVNAGGSYLVLNQQKQKEREDQFEAVERNALAQPDAWKAYLQVSDAVPADAPIMLQNRYRSLAISLALKAAMACSPDALKLLGRNDVIEFRVLRSSLVSACKTAK
ncbi:MULTISPECIES: hypothetical protein [Enterobacter]|uniref:hypothetical protein n=1 Tax=Enterobacter TaxID=547 RepID=UPI001CBE12DE|nr:MULTISPECIES: hypothetical protein [Enterobacter]UAN38719.1 hypothetical protein KGP18_22570 [Enterobacter asburiae]UAN38817.1 hypothetical protein KGP18_23185 [Enterobacter asburiae]UAN43489.1 hypothetical protein KGP24_24320 [Enterobacter sp. JBIWA008]UXP26391.1 hypothetical protein N8O08_23135 [Enterobacter sp. 155105]